METFGLPKLIRPLGKCFDLKGDNAMSKRWWKAAGIRAIKTFAQAAIAMIGTAAVLRQVDWIAVLSASVLAAILSLLTSLTGLPEVKDDDEC